MYQPRGPRNRVPERPVRHARALRLLQQPPYPALALGTFHDDVRLHHVALPPRLAPVVAHVAQVGAEQDPLLQLQRPHVDLPRVEDVAEVGHEAEADAGGQVGEGRGRGVVAHRLVLVAVERPGAEAGQVDFDDGRPLAPLLRFRRHVHLDLVRVGVARPDELGLFVLRQPGPFLADLAHQGGFVPGLLADPR